MNARIAEVQSFKQKTRATILHALEGLRTDQPYAVVDYPNYFNPGDAAIWAGTLRLLASLNSRPPAFTSSLQTFSPAACRRAVGSTGTIFLTGGGNFGTLYAKHHARRLRLISTMSTNSIVQLPQSLALGPNEVPEETTQIFSDHPSVRLFAREKATQEALSRVFRLDADLCPDMAFGLSLRPVRSLSSEIVGLLRIDAEGRQPERLNWPDECHRFDWKRDEEFKRQNKLITLASRIISSRWLEDERNKLADRQLQNGIALIERLGVLVTDRLHGHILATMLGIPHVVLNNSTGKVSSYFSTWTRGLSFVRHAQTLEEAIAFARQLQRDYDAS